MIAWQIFEPKDVSSLRRVEIPQPESGPGEVLVKVRAVSLNYRDLTTVRMARPGNLSPLIPCSDGAGEIVAVGAGVTAWKAGDRVIGSFFQAWQDGPMSRDVMRSALGGPIHGLLAEYAVLRADSVVLAPDGLTFGEAACLPCAGLTAWHSLVEKGGLHAGQTILLLGTGGVSIFALQLARLHGARVIITSSSDEKLERARKLGAAVGINYRSTPDWEREVFEWTGKEGVDHVIEVGGAGTLEKSLASARYGGRISLMGVLTGFGGKIDPWPVVAKSLCVQGIYVGSTAMLRRFATAVGLNALQPVVDRSFAFDAAPDAFFHLESGQHFGKIVVEMP